MVWLQVVLGDVLAGVDRQHRLRMVGEDDIQAGDDVAGFGSMAGSGPVQFLVRVNYWFGWVELVYLLHQLDWSGSAGLVWFVLVRFRDSCWSGGVRNAGPPERMSPLHRNCWGLGHSLAVRVLLGLLFVFVFSFLGLSFLCAPIASRWIFDSWMSSDIARHSSVTSVTQPLNKTACPLRWFAVRIRMVLQFQIFMVFDWSFGGCSSMDFSAGSISFFFSFCILCISTVILRYPAKATSSDHPHAATQLLMKRQLSLRRDADASVPVTL